MRLLTVTVTVITSDKKDVTEDITSAIDAVRGAFADAIGLQVRSVRVALGEEERPSEQEMP